MLRYALFSLVLCLLLSGSTLAPGAAARIDAILADEAYQPGLWSVFVADAQTGEPVYGHNPGIMMLPASSTKLFTVAVGLDALGSDYRYETRLRFQGTRQQGVLDGDLVVQGAGDPSFGSSELAGPDPLRVWARGLAAQGVRRIEGRLIGYDDSFSDAPYAEGWDVDYIATQSSRLLGVSASGLSYHDNLVVVQLRPGKVGQPPTLTASPPGFLDLDNTATTSARRRGRAARVQRVLGSDRVSISGSIASSYAATYEIPVYNPTLLALHAFREALREAGITVTATLYDIDMLDKKPALDGMETLFTHQSPPLSDILKVISKKSNNFYAEQLFRTIAWGGSAAGGEARIKALVEKAGGDASYLSIRDGSGLSRKSFVTAEALGHVLVYMNSHPERAAFRTAMAGAGEPQSTLRYRLKDLPVIAKTGSLEYVRALAGYIAPAGGRELVFVVFANNFAVPPYRITQAIDAIVTELATLEAR